MANPNPRNKFQKGNKLGRQPGQPNLMPGEALTHCAAPRPFGGVKAGGVQTAAAESYVCIYPIGTGSESPRPTARLKRSRAGGILRRR